MIAVVNECSSWLRNIRSAKMPFLSRKIWRQIRISKLSLLITIVSKNAFDETKIKIGHQHSVSAALTTN